jgi:hypothetical protein
MPVLIVGFEIILKIPTKTNLKASGKNLIR